MHKFNLVGSAALVTLAMLSACGGEDDDGGGAGPGFSIPDSAVIGTLTDEQKTTLCNESRKWLTDSGLESSGLEFSCRLSGILAGVLGGATSDAALQAACKASYDQCKTQSGSWSCTPPTSSCMATVGDLRACMQEADTVIDQSAGLLPPCDQVTLMSLGSFDPNDVPKTPACDTFEAKCPDFDLPTPDVPGL